MNALRAAVLLASSFVFSSTVSSAPEAPAPLVSDTRFAELQSNAPSHSPDTLLELALAHDERRHHAKAAELYQLAAAQGIGAAELRLGALYESGQGVTQSYVQAHAHYQRAVAAGVPEAHLRLGFLYFEGWGVPADTATAVAHIERAAQADYQPAQQILSAMNFAGLRMPRDLNKALYWADRAAAQRDPDAMVTAGLIRQRAAKLPHDLQLAREWYQLSAEQDFTRGMVAMASSFLQPGAKPEDVALGIRWLELAADGGNSAAAFYLAGIYLLTPAPVEGDRLALARSRLTEAASAGEPQAAEVLEFEKAGQPLPMAFGFVLHVPFEERHVQRLATDPRFAEDAHGNRMPRPLKLVAPVYPTALRLSNTEGSAIVEFVIDTTGRVREPKVVEATHPGFSDAALAAISAARFEPAKKNGSVVNVRVRQPIHFNLSDIATPESQARDRARGLNF